MEKVIFISANEDTLAESNKSLIEIKNDLIRSDSAIQIIPRKGKESETQDLAIGIEVVIGVGVAGAAALLAVAKGIRDWIAKGLNLEITNSKGETLKITNLRHKQLETIKQILAEFISKE